MRHVQILPLLMSVLLSASCSNNADTPLGSSSTSGSGASTSSGGKSSASSSSGSGGATGASSSSGLGGAPGTSSSDVGSGASSSGGDGGPCGPVYGNVGCCRDNTLYYCKSTQNGVTVVPCTGGKICSWASAGYYDCIIVPAPADAGPDAEPVPQSDPSNMYPRTCM